MKKNVLKFREIFNRHSNVVKGNVVIIIICILMYICNELYLKNSFSSIWIHGYFNDCLAGIILLAYVQIVLLPFFTKKISFTQTIVLVFFSGLYWEFIAPLYRMEAVTDHRDLIAYELGGIICFMINKIIIGRKK